MAEAQEPIGTEFHFIKPLRPSDLRSPSRTSRKQRGVCYVQDHNIGHIPKISVEMFRHCRSVSFSVWAVSLWCWLGKHRQTFFLMVEEGAKKTVFSLAESDICRHLNPDGKHLHHQQILAPQNDDSSCFAHWVQIVRVDLWQRPRFFETHMIICEFVPGCHPPFLRNPDLQTTWSSKTWWKWGMFFLERHVLLVLVLDVMGRPCCVKRFFQTSWDVPLKPTVRWEPRRFVGWF